MPTSDYQNTSYVLNFLHKLEPGSILDVGAGFGRWGFLCRCHLDMGHSLSSSEPHRIRVDAVEAYEGNINPMYDCIYDNTYRGDARDVVPALGSYDVIICGDMIEHLEKEDAWKLIRAMQDKAKMMLVVSLPFGECPQEASYGNEYEVHRAVWRPSDFRGKDCYVKTYGYHLPGVRIGTVAYPCSDHARWLMKNIRNPIRRTISRLRGFIRNAVN